MLFLMLSSAAALQQWKALFRLVCASPAACEEHATALAGVDALRAQLEAVPADLFTDDMTADNFLRPALRVLCLALDSLGGAAGPQLRTYLSTRFGLSISTAAAAASSLQSAEEDEEDQPVVAAFTEDVVNQHGLLVEVPIIPVDSGEAGVPCAPDTRPGSSAARGADSNRMEWMLPPVATVS